MTYQYMMIQVPPTITVRAKEHRGNEAAMYLQELATQHAAQGWEFYRVDEVGVVVRKGCLAGLLATLFGGGEQEFFRYFVITFRRQE